MFIDLVVRFSTLFHAPVVPVADSICSLAPSRDYRLAAEGKVHVGTFGDFVYLNRLICNA